MDGSLEAGLARLLGARQIRWVSSAADAWRIALAAAGAGSTTRVVAPAGLSPAAVRAVEDAGARLGRCDLDPLTGSPRWDTGGDVLILDHRHGHPVPPPTVSAVTIVEDATASAGGSAGTRPVGSLGALAIMALGGALFPRTRGALVAANLAATAGFVDVLGETADLAGFDEAALRQDFESLVDRVDARRAAAQVYDSAWRPLGLPLRRVPPLPETVPTHVAYLIQVDDAAALQAGLRERGITTSRPFDAATARSLEEEDQFPGAREFLRRTLILPNDPEMGLGDLLYVADAVRRFLKG